MNKLNYILSPCGTSLLHNKARDEDEKKIITKYANTTNPDEIPSDHRQQLEELIDKISGTIESADYSEAEQISAELNGIIKIYGGTIPSRSDFHLLLSTDTWLGENTAKLVEKWLRSKNRNLVTYVHRHTDLQTGDIASFQASLSDLVKKLSEEIPAFSEKGYRIIFNLTGGFKSVLGFLQSISNFYADETVYIFETSSELMRIPKLPIRMDATKIIEENITSFRNLSLGLPVSGVGNIPETLLFSLDGQVVLSPWGELVFSTSKKEIYKKCLLPSPAPSKIRYSDSFERSVRDLSPDRIEILNNRIDQLNRYLHNTSYNPKSLDFKQLAGKPLKSSTHEMDAWADLDAKRIFGHFEESVFVLDNLDKGLH